MNQSIIRPTETADGGYLRLPTEEQYLIYNSPYRQATFIREQDSTYNDNAFTWPIPTLLESKCLLQRCQKLLRFQLLTAVVSISLHTQLRLHICNNGATNRL
jgi:hypothetical protein